MGQYSKFIDTCGEYLSAESFPASAAHAIAEGFYTRYSEEPWRRHHDSSHLDQMVDVLVPNIADLENPRRVFWSLIGHDSIYLPELYHPKLPKGLNEEKSAQLTIGSLSKWLNFEEVEKIGEDIRSTADHKWNQHDKDQAYLLDADLSILGSEPEVFDEYDRSIREEYSFVDLANFRFVRRGILKHFFENDRLFLTDVFYEQFETQSKENLERKIEEYYILISNN